MSEDTPGSGAIVMRGSVDQVNLVVSNGAILYSPPINWSGIVIFSIILSDWGSPGGIASFISAIS